MTAARFDFNACIGVVRPHSPSPPALAHGGHGVCKLSIVMATARKLNYLASAHTCNHTSTDRDLENQRVVIQYKYKQMKLSLGVIQTVQHTVQVIETGITRTVSQPGN